MLFFSNRKLLSSCFVVFFLGSFSLFFGDEVTVVEDFVKAIPTKTNHSNSLEALCSVVGNEKAERLKSDIKKHLVESIVKYSDQEVSVFSREIYEQSYLLSLVDLVVNEKRNLSVAAGAPTFKEVSVYIDDSLCELLGVETGVVLPGSLVGDSRFSIVLPSAYTKEGVSDLFAFAFNAKNQKKYAVAEPTEDLRLRINIVYIDKDLVGHDELALIPTTVTISSVTNFRAKGGYGEYYWRLIPAEGSDSRLSGTEGSDISYTASTNTTRSFDVVSVTDGIEEYQLNVIVVKARLKKDGSGAKGGCFIRSKHRD